MSFPRYPEYKGSGVEWLGEVPAHWEVERIKRRCDVFPSNVDKKMHEGEKPVLLCNYTDVYYNDRIVAGLDFMAASATDEQIVRFTLQRGDTIITKDSETADDIGISAFVPDDLPGVVCGYHLTMIRPSVGIDGAFVKRLFDAHSTKAHLEVSANGLTRVGLGQYALDNLTFAWPPLNEQRNIAVFLDRETAKIDALVAEQEKLIALLQEKCQAVISHAVTKGLDPNVNMKDSGVEWLGAVPAHWEVLPLKRCCSLLKDGTHLPPPRVADGVPLLSVRNVQNGQFGLLDDDSFISEKDYNELCRSFVPRPSDVLLAIVGATLGKTAVIPHGLGQFHIQRSLAIFRTAERLNSDWLHLIFQSDRFQTLLWEYVGYSAQPGIYLGTLCDFRVPVPPIDEQERITAMVKDRLDEFNELICEAKSAVTLLQERRTALISAAVTGQIDVRGLAGGANTPVSLASSADTESA